MKKNIAVIGAGVSGITTAVLLQHLGFKVTIYSKELPYSIEKNPSFASLFPSASIIPHSVFHPDLESIFENSQSILSSLYASDFSGLQLHEHFELFAFSHKVPSYAQKISGFKTLDGIDWYPKHPTIEIISGWKFDCFFADWTLYFPRLIQEFSDNKGVFITYNINLNSFKNINEDIIINCTGIGSHQLEEKNVDPIVLLGHLLKIDQTPQILSPNNNIVSYNFSPGKDIYSDSFGTPFDVYAYPRKNDWVLGGSRFKGTLDCHGNWISKDPLSDQFPIEIEKLNAEILKHTFGVDLESFGKVEQQKAYRYVRNLKDGLRIEKSENSDRMVIHNYGHGGAGVTLSWGAAFEVLTILAASNISDTYSIEEVSETIRNL